jgi:hypothetical protein
MPDRIIRGVPLAAEPRRWNGEAPTREEILAEIARELAKRRQVYPKWVLEKKLTQATANERIDRLQGAYDYIGETWPATQKSLPL